MTQPNASQYQRVPRADLRRGLALLLTGRPDASDPAVEPFLAFAQQQRLSLDELWVATQGSRWCTAALLITSPGRAGMLFVSPLRDAALVPAQVGLMDALCRAQRAEKVKLVQSLLDMDQHDAVEIAQQAGFEELATLSYLQRAASHPHRPLDLGDPELSVLPWSEDRRPDFERAIESSYIETRDCPGLLGLRTIEDIIEGHKATGDFHPELWHLIRCHDELVGIMLLSEVPPRRAMELVYLGIAPAWRGKGLGRRLVRYALGLTGARGQDVLMLAVDEDNEPALKLYRALGFSVTSRKRAMIRRIES